jgi:hypothetical protein
MAEQIIRQPDGRLAVFSSVVDAFVVIDATPDELIDYRAEEAAIKARERARTEIDRVLSGEPKPYHQFTLTWDEAVQMDREHGGDVFRSAPAPGSGT